jgi:Calcineurin-like phosphoesterase
MNYDIIGDIHGHCDKLEALLRKMGYRETSGTWRHPERTVVFVGDFVDRGPAQLRTVQTARRMVDAGTALAVMGNHELNAIAWHTPDRALPGEFLRPHTGSWGESNRDQHKAFLAEVEHDPALHTELIEWFLTLPLWLDLPGLRVVHACWHVPFMAWLTPHLRGGRFLTRELMVAATDEPASTAEKDNATPSVFKAVEALTKGIEVPLPDGRSFTDAYQHVRTRVRVRWWDDQATTYRTSAMLTPAERDALPDIPLPAHARLATPSGTPLFFGHYWLTGTPQLQSSSAACVDFSAGKGGPLVAYRFDGQPALTADKLTWAE